MTKRKATQSKLTATPPKYLGAIAKQTYKQVVNYLKNVGNVTRDDKNLIEQYATQYEVYRDAYNHIREHGEVTPIYKTLLDNLGKKQGTDFLGYKRNPMTSIYNDAQKQLVNLGAQLGLSPKSRNELNKMIDNSVDSGKDKLKQIADAFK